MNSPPVMKPIKILHLITCFSGDGAQRMLLRLISAMDRSQFESHVITLLDQGTLRPEFERLCASVRCVGIKSGAGAFLKIPLLNRMVQDVNPAIIQGWLVHGNVFASLSALTTGFDGPHLWNVRRSMDDYSVQPFPTRILIRLGAIMSRIPDKVIYCTGHSMVQHQKFGYLDHNSMVIGNGFDFSRFEPAPDDKESLRAELGVSSDAVLIGIAGRDDPAKGHDNFIDAVAPILKERTNAYAVMVGRGITMQNPRLADKSRAHQAEDRFFMLGERNDLPKIMRGLDIYCSASTAEGFPNVIAEAMAAGAACVVTDAGGSREIVGDTGFVVPVNEVSLLRNALAVTLDMSADERRERGERSRARAHQNFGLATCISKYEELYRSLSV